MSKAREVLFDDNRWHASAAKILERAVWVISPSIPREIIEGLSSSYLSLARKEFSYTDFKSESDRLMSALCHSDSTGTLSPEALLNLSKISQLFGHFRLGAELHQMGKAAGLERTCSETNLPALQWALENGATAEAVEVRFEQIIRGNNTEAERAKTLIRGYFGKTALEAVGVIPAPQTAMARLVGEKKVALVGPQELTDQDVKEAFRASIMGIVNPTREQIDSLGPKEMWLGFFGNGFARLSPEAPEVERGWNITIASYKSKDVIMPRATTSYHQRVMFRYPFSSGTRLMVQSSIFDLLQFYPNSVSLYGSDLYLTSHTHAAGYIPDFRRQNKSRHLFYEHPMGTGGFMHHDLFSNFCFTALLHGRGLLSSSGALRESLSAGLKFYASRLERMHIEPALS